MTPHAGLPLCLSLGLALVAAMGALAGTAPLALVTGLGAIAAGGLGLARARDEVGPRPARAWSRAVLRLGAIAGILLGAGPMLARHGGVL